MIYWDNNATTRMADEVLEAMLPYLKDQYYNPSAAYRPAKRVRAAMQEARDKVAAMVGAHADEIIFTSGGTEASNAALAQFRRFIYCATDHSASRFEPHASIGPVLSNGLIDLPEWKAMMPEHEGISFAWANHETGVIQPLRSLCLAAEEAGLRVHADIVQAAGKLPLNLAELPLHFASMSAHKLHGPKGVGALYVRRGTAFSPHLRGATQEDARRAGTENVAGIIGFGKAAELAMAAQEDYQKLAQLRNRLEQGLAEAGFVPFVHGKNAPRLPQVSNMRFEGQRAEPLMLLLEANGLICSAGAACNSAEPEASKVLLAMGLSDAEARGALRFSLSRYSSEAELEAGLATLIKVLQKFKDAQSSLTGGVTIYQPKSKG